MSAPPTEADIKAGEAYRKRDRAIGLGIVAACFASTLGISYWSRAASTPEKASEPEPPKTEGIAGWPKKVDPIETLITARKMTKRISFRGMVASGVSPDGTLDMTSKASRVRYSFQSPSGHGPQPPRPPGTLPKRSYCGKQNIHLKPDGLVADPDIAAYPCPSRWTDALPAPRCGLKKIWDHAIAAGADGKRLARIEYYRSRAGPAWRFEIPGSRHRFSLYGDCDREIKGPQAAGSVP